MLHADYIPYSSREFSSRPLYFFHLFTGEISLFTTTRKSVINLSTENITIFFPPSIFCIYWRDNEKMKQQTCRL